MCIYILYGDFVAGCNLFVYSRVVGVVSGRVVVVVELRTIAM